MTFEELADSRIKLRVPVNTEIQFDRKLCDILGFEYDSFEDGEHISDYPLELNAGITELYMYTDVVSSSFLGDTLAPILKIIPIGNENGNQIIKYFPVPLYFPVKKRHFDTIDIELRTSAGTPMKFISGKTNLVLSFRRKPL